MLDLEKFKVRNGEPLTADVLNERFYALVRRLHELERVKVDWESAVSALQNLGLTKIIEYIQPLIEDANARIQAVETEAQEWADAAESWAGQAQEAVADGIGPHDADAAAHPAIRTAVAQVASDLSGHAADGDLHQDAAGAIAGHDGEAGAHGAAIAQHNGGTGAHSAAIAAQRPWATSGEAVAGTATNSVMSPALVAAAISALTPAPDVAGQIDDRMDNLMMVIDQKPNGTPGGTYTSGAWRTRDINTVLVNNIAGATLANNFVTLQPGLYYICWNFKSPMVRPCSRLRNVTTGATYNGMGMEGYACVAITGTCQYTIEQFCYYTSETNSGFGYPLSEGIPECYAQVFINKLR